jgi:carboxylesterase type B
MFLSDPKVSTHCDMGEYTPSSRLEASESFQTVEINTRIGKLTAECQPYNTPLGRSSRDITHILRCRGIQYADIPHRWAPPRATACPWSGVKDCTQFGPGCPQSSRPLFDVEGIPLFGRMSASVSPIQPDTADEFACLNLNIFAPVAINQNDKDVTMRQKFPVLVWVHGGSYQVGCGGVSLYGMSVL